MTLEEYQERARRTAHYADEARLLYPVLKLTGEAGEVSQKLGKLMRDEGWRPGTPLGPAARDALVHELGDVLWYLASIAADLGVTLEDVATANLDKLTDRASRGVIGGSGDDR